MPLDCWYHTKKPIINQLVIHWTQDFEIVKIIPDIKVICAIHLSFSVAENSESRKIWPPKSKRANPCYKIHPQNLWLQTNIQNDFDTNAQQLQQWLKPVQSTSKLWYHKFLKAPETFDSLEVSKVLQTQKQLWYLWWYMNTTLILPDHNI